MIDLTQTIHTTHEDETKAVAVTLAGQITSPMLICLYGDLGMGKSVFARALIRTLCDVPDLDIPSPTYTLVQTYECSLGEVYHYDLYRIQAINELHELGWDDALYDGIVITEWSERITNILPTPRIDIHILPVENAPSSRIIKTIHHTNMIET